MRAFLTLVLDVPREVRRKKSIISLGLLILMSLVFSICFGIEKMPLDTYFKYTLRSEITEGDFLTSDLSGRSLVGSVRGVDDIVPWPTRVDGGRATTIDFNDDTTQRGIAGMLALRNQVAWPTRSIDGRPAIEVLVERTLADRFDEVAAFADSDLPNRVHVAIKDARASFPGARYTIFFGSIEEDLPTDAQGRTLGPQQLVDGLFSSWMANGLFTIVILVMAAGFVPQLLTRGNVEPVLARPVSRATVLLGTYGGTVLLAALYYGIMAFVLFVGFSQTVATPSTEALLAVPGFVLLFASVTAGAVLAGTLIRANAFCSLTAVGLYIFPQTIAPYRYFSQRGLDPEDAEGGWVITVMEGLWWTLPKITEIELLSLPESPMEALFRNAEPDPTTVFSTTIAFAVVCLSLAWVRARRMEF